MPVKILLTGFGAFPGARINPSTTLVNALALRHKARCARFGIELHTAFLPVEFSSLPMALREVSESVSPHAILHVGLAGRRRQISVELVGRNRLSLLHPDAARKLPLASRICQGPEVLKSSLPAQHLLQLFRTRALPASLSIHAGDYVCNQTLYLSLAWAQDRGIKAGFIHIPRLAVLRMDFAGLVRAFAEVVIAMAVACRVSGLENPHSPATPP